MDRFNPSEDLESTIKDKVAGIVYSDASLKDQVDQIVDLWQDMKSTGLVEHDDEFMIYKVTECCLSGPITQENYCPNCGAIIIKNPEL
jgi:hypothetical protein